MKTGTVLERRFELRQVLGEGGMGQVFKAWDAELERFVAVKVLLPQFLSDPSANEEMKQEVRLSQRLSHPSIVAVYDYRVHNRTPYIVMEYVEGTPLHVYLFRQPGKKLDEAAFLTLADRVLAAVGYAHEQRVVHRDLKPSNIMVMPNQQVKLMDFGIAATLKATYTRMTGRTSGLTIQYSSPEQINGENPSPSMDIYSLGCVFYEMLTGHPPFYQGEVLHQHLTRPAAPMPGVSQALNAAVLGCLVKDPQKRMRSVQEVRAALTGERPFRVAGTDLDAGAIDIRSRAAGPPFAPAAGGARADQQGGRPEGVQGGAQPRSPALWRLLSSPWMAPLAIGSLGTLVLVAVVVLAVWRPPSFPAAPQPGPAPSLAPAQGTRPPAREADVPAASPTPAAPQDTPAPQFPPGATKIPSSFQAPAVSQDSPPGDPEAEASLGEWGRFLGARYGSRRLDAGAEAFEQGEQLKSRVGRTAWQRWQQAKTEAARLLVRSMNARPWEDRAAACDHALRLAPKDQSVMAFCKSQ